LVSARATLLAALPYATGVSLLLGRVGAFPFLALGWVIAVVTSDEPSVAPTSGRQGDVGRFQRTSLGQALTYREGWVPSRARPWTWWVALGLLFGPGAALAWRSLGGAAADVASLRLVAGALLASPVAVLSAGFIAETLLVQPLVAPFIGLAGVLALVASAADGRWSIFQNVLAGGLVFVALLYAVDLVRLIRREGRRG
jgi:hypothetical protein